MMGDADGRDGHARGVRSLSGRETASTAANPLANTHDNGRDLTLPSLQCGGGSQRGRQTSFHSPRPCTKTGCAPPRDAKSMVAVLRPRHTGCGQ